MFHVKHDRPSSSPGGPGREGAVSLSRERRAVTSARDVAAKPLATGCCARRTRPAGVGDATPPPEPHRDPRVIGGVLRSARDARGSLQRTAAADITSGPPSRTVARSTARNEPGTGPATNSSGASCAVRESRRRPRQKGSKQRSLLVASRRDPRPEWCAPPGPGSRREPGRRSTRHAARIARGAILAVRESRRTHGSPNPTAR
jgi:hypothetical protein